MRVRSVLPIVLLLSSLSSVSIAAAADPRCTDQGEQGPCKALLERYGYDPMSGTCKEIIWGGCGEPVPFETKEECLQVCGGTKALVISDVEAFPKGRLPYALLSVEYPKSWNKPDFTVKVNDREVPFRSWGGGSSRDRQTATFLVFPGAAGVVRVTVQASADGKTFEATDTLRWNVWSMAGLLDGPGRLEAVMDPRPLRFWAFPADNVRVRFNGQPVSPTMNPMSGKSVGLFSITPAWQAGKNTLSIETTGMNGKSVTTNYDFVYVADGTVSLHETLVIPYGTPGGKSGPFYSVELAGGSLMSTGEREESYYTVDPEGWVLEQTALVQAVKAERTGEATVRILVKRHFLQAVELEREFRITVIPSAGR